MSRKAKDPIKGAQAFSMILQLGINMLVPILLCFFLGNYIYKKTGLTWPLMLLILLGIFAAFNSCYRLVKKLFLSDKEDNESAKETK